MSEQAELHQAKAEWFEEKKRARELESQLEFVRGERDRLRVAVEESRVEIERLRGKNNDLLSNEEAEIARQRSLNSRVWRELTAARQVLAQIADPEVFDLDARAMRAAALKGIAGQEVDHGV